APDAPEKMKDTQLLWKDIQNGDYEICISDIVIAEIERCKEPKYSFMLSKLFEIKYVKVIHNIDSDELAKLYAESKGLPPKSKDDARHIAIATVNNCNAIVSWNFKHIVNLRAMTVVESVNLQSGYSSLRILSPTMLLKEEE
ncbi:MAG: hypothetical protein LBN20_01415, partial [Endomicrobium sp.]|nr:hypothetical protein [Endomicrobium sp.]